MKFLWFGRQVDGWFNEWRMASEVVEWRKWFERGIRKESVGGEEQRLIVMSFGKGFVFENFENANEGL